MVNLIRKILDLFYPLVSKIFDKTTYYYAACGTGNLVLSWVLFFVFFQFVFQKKIFYVESIHYSLSAYSLSSFVCFVISFSIGFLLMKYVVFTKSEFRILTNFILLCGSKNQYRNYESKLYYKRIFNSIRLF